ncbi:laminin subunit gamma-3 [Terrapene carolina triunguis]|uniref:laminin subunit gamma-3 n=1 Tax=Terrapene triunguis TaxID=2587831 RepID=UPI000E778B54|nr:laminin subunit gamma-3 [Terrapene carolina triunguis]
MAQVPCLCVLALLCLGLRPAAGGMDSCYDPQGRAQRCTPAFENAAFGRDVRATNTCGSPPEDYCLQMGARDATKLCHRCDAGDPLLHHNATYLTDFHSQEESTWWQSQSMAFGIQHPNSVNITLHLGKSYEITYVRLKFHTSRPESFAIYKRSRVDGPWIPYQYYSASCGKTYRKQERQYLRPGEDEQVAFCTEEFSDISPLSGGNVAFSTLEGRPSAYSFDKSPVLQEWVTGTDLLISLNRLNTFGDDIFKDPKVLQSYYYAISDFSVGGRCKCNGHANACAPNEVGQLVCLCQHNTTGMDCEQCQAFYQDRPWARGTAESANECLSCNCSGRSVECFYDWELYRSTGHGGHCLKCQDNTDGPHCERCRQNYYRWDGQTACQPCNCNTAGSLRLQCDDSGACDCKASVTGWKCERCRAGFHSLSEGGCRPCACDPAGSVGTCDPNSGRCSCKEKVEGYLCNRCQPGSFNLQPHNPAGCTSCFCYGHSTVCTAAAQYEVHHVRSDFSQGPEGWRAEAPGGKEGRLRWANGEIYLEQDGEEPADFIAPEKFLRDQHLSYGQLLSLLLRVEGNGSRSSPFPVRLVLEGDSIAVSVSYVAPAGSESQPHHGEHKVTFRLHEAEEEMQPSLSSFNVQRLLSNLTALRIQAGSSDAPCRVSLSEVQLTSARPGHSLPAQWVEECICPQGYTGQFCESCAPGYKREIPLGGPFTSCIPCTCNQHGSCDPDTGRCQCLHHTEGPSCERCTIGFHGNPFVGHFDDCQPCPCPDQSPCMAIPESGELVCTHCPQGQRGRRCELCDDGFFGDPLGRNGPAHPCSPCQCNGNVDPNAVGNCDPVSGQCLRCLYNTSGEHCEKCREGFYGSALARSPARKCAPCECNPVGSAQGLEACDLLTGQCTCLPHVTGRDCSRCQPGYYDLQPGTGCKSCECHPVGSQDSQCHPLTGQCPCQPGVEGQSCDRCQPGFFGFSVKGCRACNCSPLGAVTPQCHENSTCVCSRGFVGYKCDRCEVNFFYAPERSLCQECPICYGLVKDEADKLKAKLQQMEARLQKPDCSSPRTRYPALGEEPRGDQLPDAKAVFLEQVAQLEGSVGTAWGRLRNISGTVGCASGGDEKTCVLLSEISAVLRSTQRELQQAAATLATMVIPHDVSQQPTSWSRLALESRALAASHGDAAAELESVARRALLASNTSYALLQSTLEDSASLERRRELEDRYQEIQRAQEELAAGMLEVAAEAKRTFASIRQANADMAKNLSKLDAPQLRSLVVQTGALTRELMELEQGVEAKERLVLDARESLMAEPRPELQRAQQFQQLRKGVDAARTLAASSVSHGKAVVSEAKSLLSSLEGGKRVFVHQKGQAAVSRKLAIVRDRVIVDAQKKIRQAERMLGNTVSVSTAAKKTVREAEGVARESSKRSQAALREGKRERKRASELAKRVNVTLAEISRQEHVSEELGEELEASHQVRTGMSEAKKSLREAQSSLEMDIETLNNLLSSLGNLEQDTHTDTVLSTSRLQLDRLWLRLARPGTLERKLSHLQREAEQQRQKIQAFESDLQEIRADKQNLEEVLQSLPEGCSSWQ